MTALDAIGVHHLAALDEAIGACRADIYEQKRHIERAYPGDGMQELALAIISMRENRLARLAEIRAAIVAAKESI